MLDNSDSNWGKPRRRNDIISYNATGRNGQNTEPIRELQKSSQEKNNLVEHKLQRKV